MANTRVDSSTFLKRNVEDFFSASSASPLVLANPRLPETDRRRTEDFARAEERLADHILVATSGTTSHVPGENKWVALSRTALVTSAKAVNERFALSSSDVWLNPLPLFHVGGLGVLLRTTLVGARSTISGAWNTRSFLSAIEQNGATIASLVPTQLYDLVRIEARAPASLRAVLVGGGALHHDLATAATQLGWPLQASYGLSECASTVAVTRDSWDAMLPLSHVEVRTRDAGDGKATLCLRSASLLTGYLYVGSQGARFFDPKHDGWFDTDDHVETHSNGTLRFLGRAGATIKILGENVDLLRLTTLAEQLAHSLTGLLDAAIAPVADARAGHQLVLCFVGPARLGDELLHRFNERVLPFERAARAIPVPTIPRSELGKPRLFALARELQIP